MKKTHIKSLNEFYSQTLTGDSFNSSNGVFKVNYKPFSDLSKRKRKFLTLGNCNTLSACSLFNLYLLQFENNQFLRKVFYMKILFYRL